MMTIIVPGATVVCATCWWRNLFVFLFVYLHLNLHLYLHSLYLWGWVDWEENKENHSARGNSHLRNTLMMYLYLYFLLVYLNLYLHLYLHSWYLWGWVDWGANEENYSARGNGRLRNTLMMYCPNFLHWQTDPPQICQTYTNLSDKFDWNLQHEI